MYVTWEECDRNVLIKDSKEIKTVRDPQAITVSHGTYHIPANTTFYINNVALHLDPEVWRDLNLKGFC